MTTWSGIFLLIHYYLNFVSHRLLFIIIDKDNKGLSKIIYYGMLYWNLYKRG